jgi:hypothetical protein
MKNFKVKIFMFFTIIGLLILNVHKIKAQSVELGLRFMPTISSFDLNSSGGGKVNGEVTLGYGIGGFLGINFSDKVGLQGEVIYSSISQKYKEVDVEQKINLKYLNIPLLISLNTGKSKPINLNFVVGPQIGISMGSRIISDGSDGTYNGNAVLSVKKGDLGFAYGAGLDFGLSNSSRLGFGFRGVYGLLDISDNTNTINTDSYYILDRVHIKTYSVYIGLSILF